MKTKEMVCIKDFMVGMMEMNTIDKVKINITTSIITMIFIMMIMETRMIIEEEVVIMKTRAMKIQENKDQEEGTIIIITRTMCLIINLDIQTTIILKIEDSKIKKIKIIMTIEKEWIIMIIEMIKNRIKQMIIINKKRIKNNNCI